MPDNSPFLFSAKHTKWGNFQVELDTRFIHPKIFLAGAFNRRDFVQVLEYPDKRFVIDVHLHPEFLVFDKNLQDLFRGLVSAVSLNGVRK